MNNNTIIFIAIFCFALGGAIGAYWQADAATTYISDLMKKSAGMHTYIKIGDNTYSIQNINLSKINSSDYIQIGEIKYEK